MTTALHVIDQLTGHFHRVLEDIEGHDGLTDHEKKVMSKQLSVALLSLSTIRQEAGQQDISVYSAELHDISALINRFEFFIEQLIVKEIA